MDPPYAGTSDSVRDLHRQLIVSDNNDEKLNRAQTFDDLSCSRNLRLYPEMGTASSLAIPGGFRRAHLAPTLTTAASYAATPLVVHLSVLDRKTSMMTSDVVQELDDGTVLRYQSRDFRIGRPPQVLRDPSSHQLSRLNNEQPVRRRRLQICGVRPRSLPYWAAVNFGIGAILFTEGSVAWMLPGVGDEEHGTPSWLAADTVAYPYFFGAVCFTIGCYLALVVVTNANLEEEVRQRAVASQGAMSAAAAATPAVSPAHVESATSAACPPSGEAPAPAHPASPVGPASRSAACARTASFAALPLQGSAHRQSAVRRLSGARRTSRAGSGTLGRRRTPSARSEDDGCNQHAAAATEDSSNSLPPPPQPAARLRWWAFQPHSLLYWGALVQFAAALLFNIACGAGLPRMLSSPASSPLHHYVLQLGWIWLPSVAGSMGFVFASHVYLMEVTHACSPCVVPEAGASLGYSACVLNLFGSYCFLVASLFYFARPAPRGATQQREALVVADAAVRTTRLPSVSVSSVEAAPGWAFEASEWGVRLPFLVGSLCFLVASALSIIEVLNAEPEADAKSQRTEDLAETVAEVDHDEATRAPTTTSCHCEHDQDAAAASDAGHAVGAEASSAQPPQAEHRRT